MSANAPHMVDCPQCRTEGTIPDPLGRWESDTGYPLEIECPTCKGEGVVPACLGCGEPLREGETDVCPSCEHEALRDEAGDAAYRGSIGD